MALLRDDEVVFYHPSDDFTEYTLSDTWSGSGSFVTGQINNALSTVDLESFTYGPTYRIADLGGTDQLYMPSKNGMTSIDDTHIVVTWSSGLGTAQFIQARVLETDGLTIIASGDIHTFSPSRRNNSQQWWAVVHLGSGECILNYVTHSTIQNRSVRFSVSGTTIVEKNSLDSSAQGLHSRMVPIDGTRALKCYRHFINPWLTPACRVVSFSGVNDIVEGPESDVLSLTNMTIDPHFHICVPSSGVAAVGYAHDASGLVAVGTISGDVVTFNPGNYGGSGYLLHDDDIYSGNQNDSAGVTMNAVSGDYFLATYTDMSGGDDDTYAYTRVCRASGDSVILGDEQAWPRNLYRSLNISVTQLVDNVFAFTSVSGAVNPLPDKGTVSVGTVDTENMTISFTDQYPVHFDSVTAQFPSVTNLGDEHIVVAAWDAATEKAVDIKIGQGGNSAYMIADADIYPAISGFNCMAVAMWVKNPTIFSSEVIIDKTHPMKFYNDSVVFGDGDVTWTSGISDLMNSVNDDEAHLLIFHFYNPSGSNWELHSSIDGGSFTNHGNQDSGTQTLDVIDSAPAIYINNGYTGEQWIDEVVMWAGDDNGLTEEEIEQFFVHGSGGSPASTFSADITGNPWRLTRTHDHHPQILGTFAASVSGVNIQVWDVGDGENEQIIISSSGCNRIGSTNRWRWSTEYMPIGSARNQHHYFFNMIADTGEEVKGHFFLAVPEGGRWSHPLIGDILV